MKSIFRTDLFLALFGSASLLSGITIHYADHFQSHQAWHNLSVAHFFINIGLLIAVVFHIKQHWRWYKALLRPSSFKKKISILVTIAFLCAALSGIYLLIFSEGQGTNAGLVHYWLGLIFGIIAILHLKRRWKIFRKGIQSRSES